MENGKWIIEDKMATINYNNQQELLDNQLRKHKIVESTRLRQPDEILNDLVGERYTLLQKTVETIAFELEKEFKGQPLEIWIGGYVKQYEAIINPLKKKFAKSNWQIEIVKGLDSQKDSASTLFRLTPRFITTEEQLEDELTSKENL